MANSSQTQFAILGLLSLKALSGYDIKQMIEKSTHHFWNESYGNLYPTLQNLLKKKYIRQESIRKSSRKRITYALTETGKQHLYTWLKQPLSPAIIRDELLLKIFFGHLLDSPSLVQHLMLEAASLQTKISALKEIYQRLSTQHAENPHLPYWLMTMRCGLKKYEARLNWCEESIALMQLTQESGL